jgi:hypothetical protein
MEESMRRVLKTLLLPAVTAVTVFLVAVDLSATPPAEPTKHSVRTTARNKDTITYRGTAGLFPITTVFVRVDGRIRGGTYEYTERDDCVVPGVFSDCKMAAPTCVTCRWKDESGVGSFTAEFSEDFSGFLGKYRSDDSPNSNSWNGTLVEE